jgi:hypothetical protein
MGDQQNPGTEADSVNLRSHGWRSVMCGSSGEAGSWRDRPTSHRRRMP